MLVTLKIRDEAASTSANTVEKREKLTLKPLKQKTNIHEKVLHSMEKRKPHLTDSPADF
jgi:hypothetical protein